MSIFWSLAVGLLVNIFWSLAMGLLVSIFWSLAVGLLVSKIDENYCRPYRVPICDMAVTI